MAPALEIQRDPRVRAVAWRDLVGLSRYEVVRELLLPLPWLGASLALAAAHGWLAALACSFVFFLCGLRLVHNAYHYALGLPRGWTEGVILAMSVLMLGSMHAVQFNHLRHHQHCLDDEDVEALSARMGAFKALAFGPVFPVLLHVTALRLGGRRLRAWVAAELALGAAWGVACWPVAPLRYHVCAMLVGHCFTAFFAVWTVHHDCDRHHFIARTLRGRAKNMVSYHMFRHVEHHLFPAVPTCHLREMSDRLDQAAPELQTMQVF
ncbi:MAG: fatty acid desaturase [Cyanobacteria bacterium RYN_339]|nr:fatty acid desaturase [Cyanobacteria bacterium RYN_339]